MDATFEAVEIFDAWESPGQGGYVVGATPFGAARGACAASISIRSCSTRRARRRLGPVALLCKDAGATTKGIRICTLRQATGLESPIVFLCDIHRPFELEQDPSLDEDEREARRRATAKTLYMGMTRAGQRLVMLSANPTGNVLDRLAE